MTDFNKKLAKLAVNFSAKVNEGNKVIIRGPEFAKDLIQALYIETLKKGAHPQVLIDSIELKRLFYMHSSDNQLEFGDPIREFYVRNYDKLIYIQSDDYYSSKLKDIDSKKIAKANGNPNHKALRKLFEERRHDGKLDFTLIPYPSEVFAIEAGMDLASYKELVKNALFLDKEDPIKAWEELGKKQQNYIDYLEKVDEIHIMGKDTDLTLSVKGRKWINCYGNQSMNLPDGEIYTGPIEDSINGHIRFNFPGIYQGKEIEDIFLEFKNGKVINASAYKGEDFLKEILKIEGADGVGEFAMGTNYGITRFTKNMLFDEKIGGTLHVALGNGYKPTGSKAESGIHWDILKDMRSKESVIYTDGNLIFEAGKWKI